MMLCIYGNQTTAKEVVEIRYNDRIRKVEVYSITRKRRYYPSNIPHSLYLNDNNISFALSFAKNWFIADSDRAVIIAKEYLGGYPLPKGVNLI